MFSRLVRSCASNCVVHRQMLKVLARQINSTTDSKCQQIVKWRNPTFSVEINSVKDEVRQQFDDVYPEIVQDLMDPVKDLPVLCDWYKRMLDYNVPNGRKRRGFAAVLAYITLVDPAERTPEKMRLAYVIGWCAELLNSEILITDDLLDRSEVRRGLPCWYTLPDVGMAAAMDAVVVEDSAYMLLHKYLHDHPFYIDILKLFHVTNLSECIGQSLDFRMGRTRTPHWQHLTMDNYRTITKFKVQYFAFAFSVRAAMYLAGIHDPELHRQTEEVLCPLGYLLQVKNDFLDIFGTEDKRGTELYRDIREGKCAWTAVVAFERANPEQRAILERCYGQPDEECVQAVVNIYRALDMPTLFVKHEEEIYSKLDVALEQLDPRLPKQLVYNMAVMDVFRALDMPTLFAKYEEKIYNKLDVALEQLDPRLPKQLVYNIVGMT